MQLWWCFSYFTYRTIGSNGLSRGLRKLFLALSCRAITVAVIGLFLFATSSFFSDVNRVTGRDVAAGVGSGVGTGFLRPLGRVGLFFGLTSARLTFMLGYD